MKPLISGLRSAGKRLRSSGSNSWVWYRSRARWQQALIAVLIVGLVAGAVVRARSGSAQAEASQERTVTVESVGTLSGSGDGGSSIVGSVRSVTQADMLAQTGGAVRSVHTTLGAHVPAGFVIADLDNASQAAAVLQAEGSYDAAIAARNITGLQSGNTQTSFSEAQNQARGTYRSAYTALDSMISTQVDQFFGGPTPTGPQLMISPGTSVDLSRRRQALTERMNAWRDALPAANAAEPTSLLNQAYGDTQAISTFLIDLATAAHDRWSGATPAQLAAIAQARATVDAELAAISAARDAYNAKKTAAAAAGTVSAEQGTQLAAASANIKIALGSLRAAQAAYEKTRVRATIGGTVNYLPIKVGQYVSAFERVATVANNGALEIVAYVPEDERNALTVGMKVSVEGGYDGIVTSISPALDPTTKQIEVHIAVNAAPDLVNGQSVRITLPSEAAPSGAAAVTATSTPAASMILLPLASVKLLPDSRAVFTIGTDGRVVAHTVTIGDVVGDRIQVTSGLTPDLRIITDVRGLSEGQKVIVGTNA